ncbi:MAG: histidine kinase [bacterium]
MSVFPQSSSQTTSTSSEAWKAPSARKWLSIVGAWALVCLFSTQQSYMALATSGSPVPWPKLLFVMSPGIVMWALLTPAIMWLASRVPLDRRGIPVHIVAALLCGAADATLYHFIDPWVNPFGTRPWAVAFVRYLSVNMAYYIGVVAATLISQYASQLRERQIAAAELHSQLSTAHLRSLQAQLRPHFLFNTLNTVAELVHRDPDSADRIITRLGALLRRSFDTFGDQEVTLATELEFLRDYAEIICARFQDRIRITINADSTALSALVPSLILQPLVENAVRHGLEPKAEGGEVHIVVRRRVDVLELEVRDDGRGLSYGDEDTVRAEHHGVGLSNTADRLRHLYGDAQRFSVRSRVTGGTIVAIQIPVHFASETQPTNGVAPQTKVLELVR